MIPKASENLHGYHAWRRGLVPLDDGVVIKWVVNRHGLHTKDLIKAGQMFKIKKLRKPLVGKVTCAADLVYDMIQVSASGKEYKRRVSFSVEGISQYLEENAVVKV